MTQSTMTITEYGNSVPYTENLDDLSLHPVKEVIAKVLKNDAKKAFDIAAYNQFNATPLTVAPTAGTATDVVTLTTNGTVTITNNVTLDNEHVKAIVDLMKERNIPPYMADAIARGGGQHGEAFSDVHRNQQRDRYQCEGLSAGFFRVET